MPSITDEQVRKRSSLRSWIQECGCQGVGGCSSLAFWGADCRLFEIPMVEENLQGQITPLQLLKNNGEEWYQAAIVERPPGRQQFALNYFEACVPYLPYFHSIGKDPVHIYESFGDCANISDPSTGWSSYVKIHSGVRIEKRRSQGRTSRASQDPLDNQLTGTVDDVIYYVPIQFSSIDSIATSELVTGVAYTYGRGCSKCGGNGNCGGGPCNQVEYDNRQRVYTLSRNVSGTTIQVNTHRMDYGDITTTTVITGFVAGAAYPADIAVFQGHVVVAVSGTSAMAGIYYAKIRADGLLGTFFLGLNESISSMEVLGRRLLLGSDPNGLDGRLSIACSPSCTRLINQFWYGSNVSFNDIDSFGKTVLAGGTDGALAISRNGGVSWSVVATPDNATIRQVALSGENKLWFSNDDGHVYYSCNGGISWTLVASSMMVDAPLFLNPGQSSTVVKCMEFANAHVGYMTIGDLIYATYDGGANWSNGCPRFDNTPTATPSWLAAPFEYSAIGIPKGNTAFISSNYITVAGSNSTTGSHVWHGEPMIEESFGAINYA